MRLLVLPNNRCQKHLRLFLMSQAPINKKKPGLHRAPVSQRATLASMPLQEVDGATMATMKSMHLQVLDGAAM